MSVGDCTTSEDTCLWGVAWPAECAPTIHQERNKPGGCWSNEKEGAYGID